VEDANHDDGSANAVATFGGGCFWCMQPPFDSIDGVFDTTVGYSGGDEPDPTYEEVCSGRTGHVEVVRVRYDPERVAYRDLVEVFWRSIDPTQEGGQFADRGSQYRTVIFHHDDEQRRIAEESRRELHGSGIFDRPIATAIEPAELFYPAEEYHQDYYLKKSGQYEAYKRGSGRAGFLERTWGDRKE